MGRESSGDGWIRASEVGQYAYCARAWWMQRVKGFQPDNVEALERGTTLHEAHGRAVAMSHRWRFWAYGLFGITLLCIGLAMWKLLAG